MKAVLPWLIGGAVVLGGAYYLTTRPTPTRYGVGGQLTDDAQTTGPTSKPAGPLDVIKSSLDFFRSLADQAAKGPAAPAPAAPPATVTTADPWQLDQGDPYWSTDW